MFALCLANFIIILPLAIVKTFKLPRCQGQLVLFPREAKSFSDKVHKKLSDMIDSCSLPWKWSKLPLMTW